MEEALVVVIVMVMSGVRLMVLVVMSVVRESAGECCQWFGRTNPPSGDRLFVSGPAQTQIQPSIRDIKYLQKCAGSLREIKERNRVSSS